MEARSRSAELTLLVGDIVGLWVGWMSHTLIPQSSTY